MQSLKCGDAVKSDKDEARMRHILEGEEGAEAGDLDTQEYQTWASLLH